MAKLTGEGGKTVVWRKGKWGPPRATKRSQAGAKPRRKGFQKNGKRTNGRSAGPALKEEKKRRASWDREREEGEKKPPAHADRGLASPPGGEGRRDPNPLGTGGTGAVQLTGPWNNYYLGGGQF